MKKRVFLKKIIFPLLRPILRNGRFHFSKSLSGFIFVLLGMPTFLQAYIPGASYVSLTDDQGLFANPAGVSAFDSKGGLFTYQYSEEKVHQLQLGFNLGALGFSFDYQTNQKGFNESRWNLTHSFPLFHRSLFFGHRLTAFRSADFNGTAMTYSPGSRLPGCALNRLAPMNAHGPGGKKNNAGSLPEKHIARAGNAF